MNPKVLLQHLLPHRLLSTVVGRATRWRWRPWKNWLIRRVVAKYDVTMTDAEQPQPEAYPHFNAFFTRCLRSGARPLPESESAIASPADGRISRAGTIEGGRILQAKGNDFTVAELLADADAAAAYRGGRFMTIYLSPRDYHRVHMPSHGTLEATTHAPGRLFSVAPFTVEAIPRLFARNERLVCHFRNESGPFAVVLVGAMLVAGIETVWSGPVVPPHARRLDKREYPSAGIALARGEEMGRFNMGSTVIALFPSGARLASMAPEQAVRTGMAVGESPLEVTPSVNL